MERSFMNQGIVMKKLVWEEEVRNQRRKMGLDEIHQECSKRNDEKIRKALEQKKSAKKEEYREEGKSSGNNDLIVGINETKQEKKIEPEPEKSIQRDETHRESLDMAQTPTTSTENEGCNAHEKSTLSNSKIQREELGISYIFSQAMQKTFIFSIFFILFGA